MNNLSEIELVEIIACILMSFFFGLQMDASKTARKVARIFWAISLVFIWICIFIR